MVELSWKGLSSNNNLFLFKSDLEWISLMVSYKLKSSVKSSLSVEKPPSITCEGKFVWYVDSKELRTWSGRRLN